jgi:hypothetical protein
LAYKDLKRKAYRPRRVGRPVPDEWDDLSQTSGTLKMGFKLR